MDENISNILVFVFDFDFELVDCFTATDMLLNTTSSGRWEDV